MSKTANPVKPVEIGATGPGGQASGTSTAPAVLLEANQEEAFAAVAEAARLWGGEWEERADGGELEIPVAAGVRRGVLKAELNFAKEGSVTRVTAFERGSDYRLQSKELVVLLMGAAGGLFLVIAPFVPELFDLIPMAGLLLLLAWFLVVSRLKNRNLQDFLKEVEELVGGERELASEKSQ